MLKKYPIFYESKFVTDFKNFSLSFAKQYSILDNGSEFLNKLLACTENTLAKFEFGTENIAKVISNLSTNKSHSHDRHRIQMLKLCGKSISKLLLLIFKVCLS